MIDFEYSRSIMNTDNIDSPSKLEPINCNER